MKKSIFFAIFLICSYLTIYAASPRSFSELKFFSAIEFTQEEEEFILNNETINVLYNTNCLPYEYMEVEGKNEVAKGITVSYLIHACEKIGIKLNFIKANSTEEITAQIDSGKPFIISGYQKDLEVFSKIVATDVAFNLPLFLAAKDNIQPSKGDAILTLYYTDEEMSQIYSIYPPEDYNYVFASNSISATKKFQKENNRYMIVGQTELSYLSNLPDHTLFPLPVSHSKSFGVTSNVAPVLVPLLNKAFAAFTQEELSIMMYDELLKLRYSIHEAEEKTRERIGKAIYLLIFIVTLSFFFTTILLLTLYKKNKQIEYDSLTGLPAFSHFEMQCKKIMEKNPAKKYMILFMNIDNFRYINETYGIMFGNNILRILAETFKKQLSSEEFMCRFYADRFAFFMERPEFFWNIEERVYMIAMANSSIRNMLPEKYNLKFITSVYYIEDSTEPVEQMIDKANLAQKLKRNSYSTSRVIEYTAEMKESQDWRREITLSMNNAFINNEFEVYYQPKYSFQTEKIVGAEALIRWNNPQKGFLTPAKFVPLFESNGFIEKIDKLVLSEVCKFLEFLKNNKDEYSQQPLTVSFNLSRQHLYNSDLIRELKEIISDKNIGKNKIEVELTESVMFDNQTKLIKVMKDLKNIGFTVSVDDFGSGFSSLNMLKNIPADVIKLDKEFLSTGPENEKEGIIISAVVDMAKKLKIKTVAEGVETKTQCDMLKEIGCDIAQGYYYSKPIPKNEFLTLLKKESGK